MIFGPKNFNFDEPPVMAVTENGIVLTEMNILHKHKGKGSDLVFVYIVPESDFYEGCYFKCNKGSKINHKVNPLRISLKGPVYIDHLKDAKDQTGLLNGDERKNLNEIMKRAALNPEFQGLTVWETMCVYYNSQVKTHPKFSISMIDLNTSTQPDYRKLGRV